MKSVSLALALTLSGFVVCSLADEMDKLGEGSRYDAVYSKKEFMLSDRSILGTIVGESTLSDVEGVCGEAEIIHPKEGDSNYICYSQGKSPDKYYVIFEAGPLGGWKTLTSYILTKNLSDNAVLEKCTELKNDSLIISESGISLGIRREKILEILGEPTQILKDEDIYYFIHRKKLSNEELEAYEKNMPWLKDDPYIHISSFAKIVYENDSVEFVEITYTKSF